MIISDEKKVKNNSIHDLKKKARNKIYAIKANYTLSIK